jgi:hypothetical protein
MKSLSKIALVLCLVALTGCVPFWRKWMKEPTPQQHGPVAQTWCYRTLGQIDCYPAPQQSLSPDSLVSVDPPVYRPRSRDEYYKALEESQNPSKER